ncbi:MAG: DUF6478 family protein [Pseudomonadota bacterium]
MAALLPTVAGRLVHRGARRLWSGRLARAGALSGDDRKRLLREGRQLRRLIQAFETAAEGPATPMASIPADLPRGSEGYHVPSFFLQPALRPSWPGLGPQTTLEDGLELFHDCPLGEVSARQIRHMGPDGGALGLRIEALHFKGQYLSLALGLPESYQAGLGKEHLVRLGYELDFDRPLEVFARLNLRHGPNVENVVREIDLRDPARHVEFDVYYTDYEPKRAAGAWIDLIFEAPHMNRIDIRRLSVLRRPRASL